MLKKLLTLAITFALILNYQVVASYGAQNLSHEEVESIIEEVAQEKNIPAVILKAIAWKESNYRQFDESGNPFVSYGNTGIMQVNKVHDHLDQDKLRNDIRYNIEAGADILLNIWNSSGRTVPTIGDMNNNVLENWYFALWGYNGWSSRNNPNVSGNNAYQEKIFNLIRNKYNQPVTSISKDLIPSSGLPDSSLSINTPEPYHDISSDSDNDYTVNRSDNKRSVFKDITDHPQRQYIEKLYKEKIINGVGDNRFAPDETITREEMSKVILEAIEVKLVSEEVDAKDWNKVSSWAKDYIATMYSEGIMLGDGDNIRPKDFLTREEALLILHRAVGNNEKSDIELTYLDAGQISSWSVESIKYFVESEVLSMNDEENLNPKEFVTRGEISEWIVKAMDI